MALLYNHILHRNLYQERTLEARPRLVRERSNFQLWVILARTVDFLEDFDSSAIDQVRDWKSFLANAYRAIKKEILHPLYYSVKTADTRIRSRKTLCNSWIIITKYTLIFNRFVCNHITIILPNKNIKIPNIAVWYCDFT